jgi:hypothetical protein
MCFDTAKQCVLIHIHKTIIELKEFDNQMVMLVQESII